MQSMPNQTERTFSDVVQDIIDNLQSIVRAEFRLARTEIKEETAKAAKAAQVIAAGAVLGLYALGLFLLAIVRALETVAAPWLANLIVAVVVGLGALLAISIGRARIKHVHPAPTKTMETVKENVEWVKDQTK